MKKIAAFFTALGIFLAIILAFHFSLSGDLNMNNKDFGSWNSAYKDLSCNAISQNLHKDTMVVFGSSEFGHGRKTPYHPKNLFEKQNVDLMMVGGAYNQCLNHAITLGAVGNNIQKKKVVLILSPMWFYRSGVSSDKYALRFSELSYISFMQNDKIPASVKQYAASRSESLLTTNQSMLNRVKIYDKIFIDGSNNPFYNLFYKVRNTYITDKDAITIKSALKTTGIRKKVKFNDRVADPAPLNWDVLSRDAARRMSKNSHNKFYMSDHFWKKKFIPKYKMAKGIHRNEDFKTSPEYGDLECFLKVCKAENIEPMIMILPLNGRWYDYTGMTAQKRANFSKKIKSYCQEYNANLVDLSKYNYTPYVVADSVHPWGKGWVKIDEKIYNFYNKM
jgi:D-alanine transfer protein